MSSSFGVVAFAVAFVSALCKPCIHASLPRWWCRFHFLLIYFYILYFIFIVIVVIFIYDYIVVVNFK